MLNFLQYVRNANPFYSANKRASELPPKFHTQFCPSFSSRCNRFASFSACRMAACAGMRNLSFLYN